MNEEFIVSVADIQEATGFGFYRLRALFSKAPPSIAAHTSERGAAPRLFRLSDVISLLRSHRQWSSDLECALIHYLQSKEFSNA